MKAVRLRGIRRAAWAIALSAALAFVASRVNRTPLIPSPSHYALLDENISDVELDTRTFATTINSLRKKTRADLVIDPALSASLAKDEEQTPWPAETSYGRQHFHNVQLGTLIIRVLDEWADRFPVECRIEGNTVSFHPPDASRTAVTRIYDLRSVAADAVIWLKLAKSWEPPKKRVRQYGGSVFGQSFATRTDEAAYRFSRLIAQEQFKVITIWSGWVVIEAPADLQEQFQRLLVTWSQRGSPAIGDAP